MFYPEVPILYAWLIIAVMGGLDRLLGELQFHFKKINTFLVGDPRLLLKNGRILDKSHIPNRYDAMNCWGCCASRRLETRANWKHVLSRRLETWASFANRRARKSMVRALFR